MVWHHGCHQTNHKVSYGLVTSVAPKTINSSCFGARLFYRQWHVGDISRWFSSPKPENPNKVQINHLWRPPRGPVGRQGWFIGIVLGSSGLGEKIKQTKTKRRNHLRPSPFMFPARGGCPPESSGRSGGGNPPAGVWGEGAPQDQAGGPGADSQ